jgi:transcriptional regulator with XRE-family HTH domain
MQTHFGARLGYLRRRVYLSRVELARHAGLSPDLVQSLEQGRAANPTVRTVFALAGALGLPYGELMEALAQDFEGLWGLPTTQRSVGDEYLASSCGDLLLPLRRLGWLLGLSCENSNSRDTFRGE